MQFVKSMLYVFGLACLIFGLYCLGWSLLNGAETEFIVQGVLFLLVGVVLLIIGWAIVVRPPVPPSAKPLPEEVFVNGVNVKDLPFKSKTIAVLLCIFFGMLGIHQIYLGHYKKGLVMLAVNIINAILSFRILIITVIVAIVCLIDLFKIVNGEIVDEYNRHLM